jgi:DNA (cytosine-5)-methyltransferase 1
MPTFGVVDLFAGPGGLGEGFSALESNGNHPFKIGVSVEMEASAHKTLRLRAFLRNVAALEGKLPDEFIQFHAGNIEEPDWSTVNRHAWRAAVQEALCEELGSESASQSIKAAIRRISKQYDDTILIGGPPCQAYSLVGRSRAKGKLNYVPEEDARHYLFREYIRVLSQLRPAAFVMENVKGLLSSTVESRLVFEMLMEDLSSLGDRRGQIYELRAISVGEGCATLQRPRKPSDFVVRSEEFGVPQQRHRVIIIGIRSDLASGVKSARLALSPPQATVQDAIGHLPRLRSGLSKSDNPEAWLQAVKGAAKRLLLYPEVRNHSRFRRYVKQLGRDLILSEELPRSSRQLPRRYGKSGDPLAEWLDRPELIALAHHETRGHMPADLARYMFAASYARVHLMSPKAPDFPSELTPRHKNWSSGKFSDRFRVQLLGGPANTVTSHISKDGHYFIHPDPTQCRSLTVREAARLQTFPDDYYFLGNRTQQYVQVGNAVPPFLSRQIANLILKTIDGSMPRRREKK